MKTRDSMFLHWYHNNLKRGWEGHFFLEKCHLLNIEGMIEREHPHFAPALAVTDTGKNHWWRIKTLSQLATTSPEPRRIPPTPDYSLTRKGRVKLNCGEIWGTALWPVMKLNIPSDGTHVPPTWNTEKDIISAPWSACQKHLTWIKPWGNHQTISVEGQSVKQLRLWQCQWRERCRVGSSRLKAWKATKQVWAPRPRSLIGFRIQKDKNV